MNDSSTDSCKFNYKEYRNYILRKSGLDGIQFMYFCHNRPHLAGKLIYHTLWELYPKDDFKQVLLDFDVPKAVYDNEPVALWTYLEAAGIRKENLRGKRSNWKDLGDICSPGSNG